MGERSNFKNSNTKCEFFRTIRLDIVAKMRRFMLQTLLITWHKRCNGTCVCPQRRKSFNHVEVSMKLLVAYDGSKCSEAALDDLVRTGLPDLGEALVVSVAEMWLPPQ